MHHRCVKGGQYACTVELEWKKIIKSAPDWWGVDPEWKHNLLIMIKPCDMKEVISAIGELKPDIEAIQAGDGVVYQSMSKKLFGRTTTGKITSNPVYKDDDQELQHDHEAADIARIMRLSRCIRLPETGPDIRTHLPRSLSQ
ncbi:MAG: hypothetical protein Q7K29_04070 [Thermoleophilia bacterium]|nr:hypothetical protein [Thermoleophilia bacterium]